MTTSTFSIDFAPQFTLATRTEGACARAQILDALASGAVVIINLERRAMSPSFADECFGAVVGQLGIENFRRRVRLVGVADSARSLLQHVMARRAVEPA